MDAAQATCEYLTELQYKFPAFHPSGQGSSLRRGTDASARMQKKMNKAAGIELVIGVIELVTS